MRCFVSADITDDLAAKIAELQQNFSKMNCKLTECRNFHFTLKFLGEISGQRAAEIAGKLREIEQNPFEISLKGVGAFPNTRFPRIIWIGCDSEELETLAKTIDGCLSSLGFPRENDYKSHITIARIKTSQKNIQEILEQLENMEIGKMKVDNIKVKQSLLGKRGPAYKDLWCIPLEVKKIR